MKLTRVRLFGLTNIQEKQKWELRIDNGQLKYGNARGNPALPGILQSHKSVRICTAILNCQFSIINYNPASPRQMPVGAQV